MNPYFTMKEKLTVFFAAILFFASFNTKAQSLSGKVTDSVSGQPIPGAVVYIPQLKIGTATDVNGLYKITSIPKGTYEVEVEILGYATVTKQVTVKDATTFNCTMGASSSSSNEVVITALGNITNVQRSPTPVSIITHQMFIQQASTNVVDAIATQPGIDAITTGPGVSKPSINGLGYNRVLTLFDGVRRKIFNGAMNMASLLTRMQYMMLKL